MDHYEGAGDIKDPIPNDAEFLVVLSLDGSIKPVDGMLCEALREMDVINRFWCRAEGTTLMYVPRPFWVDRGMLVFIACRFFQYVVQCFQSGLKGTVMLYHYIFSYERSSGIKAVLESDRVAELERKRK